MARWEQTTADLIRDASTRMPADVEEALRTAAAREAAGSNAALALASMLENIELARTDEGPLCQDTGTLLFWIDTPFAFDRRPLIEGLERAIVGATECGILRQNCVDVLSGRNTGNNLGRGSPNIHWSESARDTVEVSLILKGGGCENVGAQYALPDTGLGAGRDLDGVRRCVLDAVGRAQGKGCAPGVLGVCIGGDRATGYAESKHQLLRRIGDRSQHAELATLEHRLVQECNSLGIGPMGFGGETTILDVFIGLRDRVPASYFVTVSYMCWSFRRQRIVTDLDGRELDP